MLHWTASSAAGWLLTGRWRPLCSVAYTAPDCAARRAFLAATDRWFGEAGHARRVHLTYVIAAAIR